MRIRWLLGALFLLVSIPVRPASAAIDRVEPPNWWIGFRETGLQLMVHGEGISAFEPTLEYPGVSIQRVERASSPNYLFIYLQIGAEAEPGFLDLQFAAEGSPLSYRYELRRKNTDPAHVRGFGPADAIYLITPDRFANGDPSNDTLANLGDPADRSKPGGRHGGDIAGIIAHLDYIRALGFTAIWLNPLLENRMPSHSYHGYSTTDFYRVDPRFGTNEQYRELVESAKEKGIGVIMDMIVNHIGSGHWWMQDLPASDWLNFREAPVITSHEHVTQQDPHASIYDKRQFSDGWFDGSMPDLNQRNPLLADYLTQNALWWIEYLGISGIRLDTYPYPDKHYMSEWVGRVMFEYPELNVVGEEWTDNQPSVAYWQRGQINRDGYVSQLPSLMDFPLQNALRWALLTEEGSKLSDLSPGGFLLLYRALANDFVYADPESLVVFPDNHDMSRAFTQLGEDLDLFRMALVYVLTTRGVPQIYYGSEILMTNRGSEDHGLIRADFPGGWAGDRVNAFTGKGLSPRQEETREFLRRLLNWRRTSTAVHEGELTHFRPENGIYVYFRHLQDQSVMVVLNKNSDPSTLELARFAERLDGFKRARDVITGRILPLEHELTLPPRTPLVLELLSPPQDSS